ncbi:MAG: Plug domain-containing protein [Cyclobacteriaceae bacterium]|nr:Plug domain-containing protein [Cyclobacteriaceae bacterium]
MLRRFFNSWPQILRHGIAGQTVFLGLMVFFIPAHRLVGQVYTERIICIADRPFYLTGENIRFAVFVVGQSSEKKPDFSNVSKIAYIELMDSTGVAVMQTSLLLDEGEGNGELLLPHRLTSGNYYLRAYTRWMRNFGTDAYAQAPLTVVNPFRNLGLQRNLNGQKSIMTSKGPDFFQVQEDMITGLHDSYERRAAVEVQLRSGVGNSDGSRWIISVSRYEPFFNQLAMPLGVGSTNVIDTQTFIPDYLPEMQGMLVTARARYAETGSSADPALFYLSAPGKTPLFFTGQSNRHGYVHFETNHIYGQRQWILQAITDEAMKLEPIQLFCQLKSSFKSTPFLIDSTWSDLILEFSRNMQVKNAYAAHSRINKAQEFYDSIPFYGTPDHRYILDEYTRFPVMEEVLREYVPSVIVRKRRDEFYFRLTDYVDKGFFKESPLMMVDGVPVGSANQIMDINPLRIRRIDVVNRRYFLGNADFSGILSLWSYEGDLAGVKLDANVLQIDVPGNQPSPLYHWPDYTMPAENSVPDLRNTLYWDCGEWKNETETLHFFTGDQKGMYKLSVWHVMSNGSVKYMEDFFVVR